MGEPGSEDRSTGGELDIRSDHFNHLLIDRGRRKQGHRQGGFDVRSNCLNHHLIIRGRQ